MFPKKATPLGSATAGGNNDDDDDGNVSGSGGDGQGTDGGTNGEGTNGGGTNGDGSGGSDSCQDRGCISNLPRIYSLAKLKTNNKLLPVFYSKIIPLR